MPLALTTGEQNKWPCTVFVGPIPVVWLSVSGKTRLKSYTSGPDRDLEDDNDDKASNGTTSALERRFVKDKAHDICPQDRT